MSKHGVVMLAVVGILASAIGCGSPPRRTSGDAGSAADLDARSDADPSRCTSAATCADSNECTTDSCELATGTCRHVPTPALCAAGESCNPVTGCEPGRPCGSDADCSDDDACTIEQCDPASRVCTYPPLDGDGDGDPPRVCGGNDCDDSRRDVFDGAPERCDLIDNDCDGAIDDGASDACGRDEVCTSGSCSCAPGAIDCGGGCTDLRSDPFNCGDCFVNCESGSCVDGTCFCAAGLTSCLSGGFNYCANTDSDRFDCGACGRSCASAETCIAGVCRGMDAGTPLDLGVRDAGRDLGVPSCAVGRACTTSTACGAGRVCQPEIPFTQGGAGDEAVYLPDGRTTSFAGLYFEGGMCTNAGLGTAASREGSPGACDPTPTDPAPGLDGCPACAKCASLGPDTSGVNLVQCFERCTPSATANPCRAGYTCDFTSDTCAFACQTDQECQLYREDTNGDGRLAAPDRLVLDVAGGATCSAVTGRCIQPGVPGVVAGATCVLDSACERDGRCLSDAAFGWPGGYCTKFGCDVLGCAGATSTCLDVGGGSNICTRPCRIADDAGDPATGAAAGDDDCRTGYACFWDGATGSVNGGCLPGNYNAVTVENIGAACADPDGAGPRSAEDVCWSPYGLGRCVFDAPTAVCTIFGCAQLPATACGVGNECVDVAPGGVCLRSCTRPTDCSADLGRANHGCVDVSGLGGAVKHCFPGCLLDGDCNAAYRCAGATAASFGECVLR